MHTSHAFRSALARLMAMETRLWEAYGARQHAWKQLAFSADPQAVIAWVPPFATRITAQRMDDMADHSWTHGLKHREREQAQALLGKGTGHARMAALAADDAFDRACADAGHLMAAVVDHLLVQPSWSSGDPMLVLVFGTDMIHARLLDASNRMEKFHTEADGSIGGGSMRGSVRLGSPSFGMAVRLAASTRGVGSGYTWHMTIQGEATTVQAKTARSALAWITATRFHSLPCLQEAYAKQPWLGTPRPPAEPPRLVREEPHTVSLLAKLRQASVSTYPDNSSSMGAARA